MYCILVYARLVLKFYKTKPLNSGAILLGKKQKAP